LLEEAEMPDVESPRLAEWVNVVNWWSVTPWSTGMMTAAGTISYLAGMAHAKE